MSESTQLPETFNGDYFDYTHLSDLPDDAVFYDDDGNVVDVSLEQILMYSSEPLVSNETSALLDISSRPGASVLLLLLCVVLLVGLLANLSVLYVLARLREARDVTLVFLGNLSLAQLLFLLVHLPVMAASHVSSQWHTEGACKVGHYSAGVARSVSALSLVAVALELVCHDKWKKYRSARSAALVSLGVWIVSLVARLPLVFGTSSQPTSCLDIPKDMLEVALLYIMPLCIMVACLAAAYRRIMCGEGRSEAATTEGQEATPRRQDATQKALLLTGLTITFAIGWMPGFIGFDISSLLPNYFVLQLLLCAIVSSLNPFLNCLLHSFRKSVYRLFCFSSDKCESYIKVDAGPPHDFV